MKLLILTIVSSLSLTAFANTQEIDPKLDKAIAILNNNASRDMLDIDKMFNKDLVSMREQCLIIGQLKGKNEALALLAKTYGLSTQKEISLSTEITLVNLESYCLNGNK